MNVRIISLVIALIVSIPALAKEGQPGFGRAISDPHFTNVGPEKAKGAFIWSHGHAPGVDSTVGKAYPIADDFFLANYDRFRFNRKYVVDWASDATELVGIVNQARAAGYKKIILAGQSAGAWISLAAVQRGAVVDGIVSLAAAHHGVTSKMRDISVAQYEWQVMIKSIRPGPRIVIVNFTADDYDVGGRGEFAKNTFAANGVQASIIDYPKGYVGHNAAKRPEFATEFSPCIIEFIETGVKKSPCQ